MVVTHVSGWVDVLCIPEVLTRHMHIYIIFDSATHAYTRYRVGIL